MTLSRVFFLHDTVPEAVGGEAAFCLAAVFFSVLIQFVPGLPALSQRLHEQGQRGQQVAEARQVEGTVVGLGVVVQEPCESQAFSQADSFCMMCCTSRIRSGSTHSSQKYRFMSYLCATVV